MIENPTAWQDNLLSRVSQALGLADLYREDWEYHLPNMRPEAELKRLAGPAAKPVVGSTTVAVELIRMVCEWDPSLRRPAVRQRMLERIIEEAGP